MLIDSQKVRDKVEKSVHYQGDSMKLTKFHQALGVFFFVLLLISFIPAQALAEIAEVSQNQLAIEDSSVRGG